MLENQLNYIRYSIMKPHEDLQNMVCLIRSKYVIEMMNNVSNINQRYMIIN